MMRRVIGEWCVRASRRALGGAALVALVSGCHLNDVLRVPTPIGEASKLQLSDQAGAEEVYAGGVTSLNQALDGPSYGGLLAWSELLSDEMHWAAINSNSYNTNVDARYTAGAGYPNFVEGGDNPWHEVLQARLSLLVAIPLLEAYEPTSGQPKVGETFALVGFSELAIAETYCGGTPLSSLLPGGGVQYGDPLTDDSILGVAEAHFDSALAHAAGSDSITALASIGLGRTLLDRNQPAAAATAVASVPAAYLYSASFETGSYNTGAQAPYTFDLYDDAYYNSYAGQYYDATFSVADREGGNGLNFISANDPRLQVDSSLPNADGGTWYLAKRFEVNFGAVPIATGVEAVLIQAEAALAAHDSTTWLTDLNALRTNGSPTVTGTDTTWGLGTGQVPGQVAGLAPLQDPGSDTARVSLTFRERAFWLYGSGNRLGSLRRLIRQYGRDQSVVYPTGPYPNGNSPSLPSPLLNYGTDVNITIPTTASIKSGFIESNPNYKGCIEATTKA